MKRDCFNETRQAVLRHAPLNGKRILEVGCGPGRVTRMLSDDAGLIIGIEPEFGALREAKDCLPDIPFLCGSGMDLPFSSGSFDAVLFTLSLHHHPDCSAALSEARRVVTPGGMVLVLEPTVESEIQRFCTVFENENHRLREVEAALPGECLNTLSVETFSTAWEFTDFEDAANYAFTYYDHPPDEAKRQALRNFLGTKATDAPIRMTDTLRLNCLRPKKADNPA